MLRWRLVETSMHPIQQESENSYQVPRCLRQADRGICSFVWCDDGDDDAPRAVQSKICAQYSTHAPFNIIRMPSKLQLLCQCILYSY